MNTSPTTAINTSPTIAPTSNTPIRQTHAQAAWQWLPEWHPQIGVLLAWPHANTDWCDQLEHTQSTYLELIYAITSVEIVWLILPNQETETSFKQSWSRFLESTSRPAPQPDRLKYLLAPYDDTWLRDTGPLSLRSATSPVLKLISFRFNGWGNKYPHALDQALAKHVHTHQLWCHETLAQAHFQALDVIAEGGNLETNGAGILLTQTNCLLNSNRPNTLNQCEWETLLRDTLGVERIWWLDHGHIAGDDTDGHIDTLVRFVAPDHLVYQFCSESDYPFADTLKALERQLHDWQQDSNYYVNGKPIRLTPLPWPKPIFNEDGERLPATYANFLIINERVLVPTYNVPEDQRALMCLQACFPDRNVIGIPCRPLIHKGGSLHCVTMHISAP